MTLDRYNKILGTVLGTLALLGAVALLVSLTVMKVSGRRDDPRVLLKRTGNPLPANHLYFCQPIEVSGTAYQLIPLVAFNPRDPNDPNIDLAAELDVVARYDRRLEPCSHRDSRNFDYVLRDTRSGKQSLLLNRPALIDSFQQAHPDCGNSKGSVPCGMRQWLLRDADSNRNGSIDRGDALAAFAMSTAGVLTRITPPDCNVRTWLWDHARNTLLYTVTCESDGDARFTLADRTDVLEYQPDVGGMASSIVDPSILAQLLQPTQ